MSLAVSSTSPTVTMPVASGTSSIDMLNAAVSKSVTTDVIKALGAAGLGAYASSQPVNDAIAKIGQDAVSALQSASSQDAAVALSKVITSDVGSVLNQYGMGSYAGSSQMTAFTQALAADVLSAAQSTGYGQAPATASSSASAVAASAVAASAVSIAPSSTIEAVSTSTSSPNTASSASTSSAQSLSTANGDDTVTSILKALAPMMGTGTDKGAVLGRVADMIGKSHVSGQVGTIMSSVASGLRDNVATATPTSTSTSTTSPSATTSSTGSASSTAATATSANSLPSSLSSSQSASMTLANILANAKSTFGLPGFASA